MSLALESFARALLFALSSGIVDAAALALLAWTAIALLRPSAKSRHALWWIALAAAAVVPLASLGSSFGRISITPAPATAQPMTVVAPLGPVDLPAVHEKTVAFFAERDSTAGDAVRQAVLPEMPATRVSQAAAVPTPAFFGSAAFAESAIAMWLVVACFGLVRLGTDMARLRAVKRRAPPMDAATVATLRQWREGSRGGRRATIRISDDVDIPAAAGFRDAAILLPSEVVARESTADLDQITLHEYAHLARYDDVTNLAERVVAAFYWFNPVVRYALRKIALEREIACDDWVVARTGRAHRYASCLLRLAESVRLGRHPVPALGALRNATQVAERIERLLERRTSARRPAGRIVTAALIGIATLLAVAQAMHAPAIAVEVPAAATHVEHVSPDVTIESIDDKGDVKVIVRRSAHAKPAARDRDAKSTQRVVRDVTVTSSHDGKRVVTHTVEVIVLPKGAHFSTFPKVRAFDVLPPLPAPAPHAAPPALPVAPPARAPGVPPAAPAPPAVPPAPAAPAPPAAPAAPATVPSTPPVPPVAPVPPAASKMMMFDSNGKPVAWVPWPASHTVAWAAWPKSHVYAPEAVEVVTPGSEKDDELGGASDAVSSAAEDYAQAMEDTAGQGHTPASDARVRAARERLRTAEKRLHDAVCRHWQPGAHAYFIDGSSMPDTAELHRALQNASQAMRAVDSAAIEKAMAQARDSMRQAMEAMRSVRSADMQRAIQRARAEVDRERARIRQEVQRERAHSQVHDPDPVTAPPAVAPETSSP